MSLHQREFSNASRSSGRQRRKRCSNERSLVAFSRRAASAAAAAVLFVASSGFLSNAYATISPVKALMHVVARESRAGRGGCNGAGELLANDRSVSSAQLRHLLELHCKRLLALLLQ